MLLQASIQKELITNTSVKGYQKGTLDGYKHIQSINGVYVDGVSITLGSPRKHVWTYAVGSSDDYDYRCCNCPCDIHSGPPPPAFVGNDYYCESGAVGAITGAPIRPFVGWCWLQYW